MRFRRRLYTRGSSYETTIPKPLLFFLDSKKKHDVLFEYDSETKRWYVAFDERAVDLPKSDQSKRELKRNQSMRERRKL